MSVNDAQKYHTNQVHFLRTAVTFSNAGETVSLGWVGAGTTISGGAATVSTAFDSGTSDTIDIGFRNAGDGTSDDPDSYATLLDVTSVGRKSVDELATSAGVYLAEGAEITATYTSTGAAPSAGSCVVTIHYEVDNS